ncbi:MAG: hypothetical protein HZA25_01635 [Candidatus Niyogibacteria bacterium]|nr:hypothetical protein [Candidatus Niyogibacteria bacterium]
MHIDLPGLLAKIKKIKPRELAYPLAMVVFGAVIIFTLVSAARFLSLNINKAFGTAETTMAPLTIDKTNYELVAKKLGIIKRPIPLPPTPPQQTATTTATPTTQ